MRLIQLTGAMDLEPVFVNPPSVAAVEWHDSRAHVLVWLAGVPHPLHVMGDPQSVASTLQGAV